MKHFIRLLTFTGLTFFMVLACTEDQTLAPKPSTNASARVAADVREKLLSLKATLPAGFEKRFAVNAARLVKSHPEYGTAINRAMKVVQPTECGPTAFDSWINQQLADWDDLTIFLAVGTGMLDFPTYDALFFENSSANQSFGVNGEYTQKTTKTFKDLQRFWDIQSKDIVLVAMHGSMLRDRQRVIRIDKILYGEDQATAEFYADLIQQLLKIVPQYRNGDHPIFTLNAFAQPTFQFPPYGTIPNKIVMGDGIVDANYGIGFADVASQSILSHEFGHHIQFQRGLFTDEISPEATRRTELMADAFSAYYLSHARGASMQWKRVQEFLQAFYAIGDCGFTSNDHHGTPKQRMAAAQWGYSLANDAQKQGHILSSQVIATMFDAKLPELVAPSTSTNAVAVN